MTNYLHIVVTFICVLFLYIHINFQLSPSEERQIFVYDQPVNIPIEEIFELKQPIIMQILTINTINDLTREKIYEECQNTDISIYDNSRSVSHAYILSSLPSSITLFETDKDARYCTEKNNENIITSTSIIKKINTSHKLFTPPLCSRQYNDILFGSDNVTTIPQHSIMFRNIFTVTTGIVDVRLIHPDDIVKNNIIIYNDYTNMTFFTQSNIDLWNIDSSDVIKATIHKGETISIPPYWVYSFRYRNNAVICASSFNSYLTELATIKHTLLYWATKFTRPSNIDNTTRKETDTDIIHEDTPKMNENKTKNDEEQTKHIIDETNETEQQPENEETITQSKETQEQITTSPSTTKNNPYPDVMVPIDE